MSESFSHEYPRAARRPAPPPMFREAHPIRLAMVLVGVVSGALWFGLLAAVAWNGWALTVGLGLGALLSTGAAGILAAWGDRGVAAGVAVATAIVIALAVVAWGDANLW